jgi:glucose-6-phosphate-specific signal transduction histidine kinase
MGMFERIKYTGGEIKISKPASGGTKILVIIPFKSTKL